MKYSAAPVFSTPLQKLLVHRNLSITDAHTTAAECKSTAYNTRTTIIQVGLVTTTEHVVTVVSVCF